MTYLKYDAGEYFNTIRHIGGQHVLDWGCNHGNFLRGRPLLGSYTGVDIDADVIYEMRTKYPEANWIYHPHYNWQYQPKMMGLTWPKLDTYDMIVSFSVFTHTPYSEFYDHTRAFKKHLRDWGTQLHTFFSTQDDSVWRVMANRPEYFPPEHRHWIADQVEGCNVATVAVNMASKQIYVFRDMLEVPPFGHQTYYITFYDDNWLANNMGGDIENPTPHFDGIRGVQRCIRIDK